MKALSIIAALVACTLSSTTSRNSYTGNGTTKTFNLTFRADSPSHVKVLLAAVGTTTFVEQTTGYTVSLNANQASAPGGSVTFTAAPIYNQPIHIERTVPIVQPTTLSPYQRLPVATVENMFDYLTQGEQQLFRMVQDNTTSDITLAGRVSTLESEIPLPGPTGPQGAKGDTGATGPKGDTGAPGMNGSTGTYVDAATVSMINYLTWTTSEHTLADITSWASYLGPTLGYGVPSNGTLYTSTDCATWTAHSAPAQFRAVAYTGSMYLGESQYGIKYSADGDTWSDATGDAYLASGPRGIFWSDGVGVALGYYDVSYDYISTSTNGTAWTKRQLPQHCTPVYAAKMGSTGGWVAVGTSGGSYPCVFMSSSDATTWTHKATAPQIDYATVAFDGVAVAAAGSTSGHSWIVTTTDGTTWTSHDFGNVETIQVITSPLPGTFAAVAYDGTLYLSSDHGASWRTRKVFPTGTRANLVSGTNVLCGITRTDSTHIASAKSLAF
jgi:hypothetical protein